MYLRRELRPAPDSDCCLALACDAQIFFLPPLARHIADPQTGSRFAFLVWQARSNCQQPAGSALDAIAAGTKSPAFDLTVTCSDDGDAGSIEVLARHVARRFDLGE